MLQIVTGHVKRYPFGWEKVYEGNVVRWTPQSAVLHHNPPRAASVRATTNWILARAEKVGALKDEEGRTTPLRQYVVSLHHTEPFFYTKDELECHVRRAILRFYKGDEVVIGIGNPRKIWATARGVLVDIYGGHIWMKVKSLRHTNKRVILQPKEPAERAFKIKKIQQVMLFREYK